MTAEQKLFQLSATSSALEKSQLQEQLSAYVNFLLLNDFDALLQLLYRVDVPEEKLKQLLRENPETNAGDLISNLLLERQLQKIQSRQQSPPATKDDYWMEGDENL